VMILILLSCVPVAEAVAEAVVGDRVELTVVGDRVGIGIGTGAEIERQSAEAAAS